MTCRTFGFLLLSLIATACGSKEDGDTASIADEQSEPAGLTSPNEDAPAEAEESEEEDPEDMGDGSEDSERNEDGAGDEDTEPSGETQDPGAEAEESDAGSGESSDPGTSSDGMVLVAGTGVPAALPATGSSGTLSTVSVESPSGLIRDLDVKIDLNHSCTKDLVATLASPSGTSVVLFDLRSLVVCSSDLEDTLLDDEASVLITRGATPFSGLHRPTGHLSDFDGEDAGGVWRLTIVDDMVGDKGTLESWSLKIGLD